MVTRRYPDLGSKSWLLIHVLLGLAILTQAAATAAAPRQAAQLSSATAPAASLLFSEFERQVFKIVMSDDVPSVEMWSRLGQLQKLPQSQHPANRALLLMHQCRLARDEYHAERPIILQQFAGLSQRPDNPGTAARLKCQQYEARLQRQDDQIFELSYQSYHQLSEQDTPLTKMWIAYDFSYAALEAGYLDDALSAATLSLEIARQNNLTEWQGESLGLIALIQNALNLNEQALQTNLQALTMVKTPSQVLTLTLNRGFMLTQAQKYEDALALYLPLLKQSEDKDPETFLMVGGNISKIYLEQGKLAENLQFTERLFAVAENHGDDYLWAYMAMARSFALLESGEQTAAVALFNKGRVWFEQNDVLMPLNENLEHFANLLHRKGMHEQAFQVLLDSKNLEHRIEESRRNKNALLQNALLDAERQRSALFLSQTNHERDKAQLAQSHSENRFWLTIMSAVVVLTFAIGLAYYRLRQAHQLLAVKNQELDYESSHDPLTKVFNRRYFQQFIQPKLANNTHALLLLLDIDHFKKVNDTHGHHAGDQVLEIVSKRLASRLRDCDCIIRWGGEEFLLYIDQPSDINNCRALVHRLLMEVESSPIQLSDSELSITISIGFSAMQFISQNALEQQLAQIDSFLYQAKNLGRNRAVGLLSITAAETVPVVITPGI